MLQIEDIRALCFDDTIFLTEHIITRMRQRQIRLEDIKSSIKNGKIVKQYTTDRPFPSCLINGDGLHIVCSVGDGLLYIITAYRPSFDVWEIDGNKRKGGSP